jgi:hypothetical protein
MTTIKRWKKGPVTVAAEIKTKESGYFRVIASFDDTEESGQIIAEGTSFRADAGAGAAITAALAFLAELDAPIEEVE